MRLFLENRTYFQSDNFQVFIILKVDKRRGDEFES